MFLKNNWGPGGGDFILVNKIRFYGNELGDTSTQPGGVPRNLFWLDGTPRLHSSSSVHSDSTFAASNVLDKSKTYWLSETGKTTNQWLVVDMGTPMYINRVSIQTDNFECSLKDFNIESCDNDDLYSWRCVRAFTCRSGTETTLEQVFEGFELRGRFVRIFCKNNHGPGGGNFILVSNIRFYGNECPPIQQQQQGYGQQQQQGYGQQQQYGNWITNNTIRVHSYSTQHQDGTFAASNLLDPNKTYWLSEPGFTTNQWVVFDFSRQVTVTKVSIQVDNWECTVKDFNIEISNNDDLYSWRCVRSFQAQCGNRNQSEQVFEGFEARGRYIRLFCKNNWGPGGGDYILITNIKFFGQ